MGGMACRAAKEAKGAGIHVHHEFAKSQVPCGRGSAGERRLGRFGLRPVGRLHRSGRPGHRVDLRPSENAFEAGHRTRLAERIAQCDPGDRRSDPILAKYAGRGYRILAKYADGGHRAATDRYRHIYRRRAGRARDGTV